MKRPLLIIFLVLLLDQALKIYVKLHFALGEEYRLTSWYYIAFAENNGMAYSMEFSGKYGKLFLSLFRIAAIVGMCWYLNKLVKTNAHKGLIASLAFIIAGAIGNVIDSAFYGLIFSDSANGIATLFPPGGGYAGFLHGKVVDMLYAPIMHGQFPSWVPIWHGQDFIFFSPTCNVSDYSVSFGVILILLFSKKFLPRKTETPKATTVEDEAPANVN
jgi:signal peptidase II